MSKYGSKGGLGLGFMNFHYMLSYGAWGNEIIKIPDGHLVRILHGTATTMTRPSLDFWK